MRIAIMFYAALVSGCAITSTSRSGPDGKPVHTVTATSGDAAYRKAKQLCPSGYRVLGNARSTALEYVVSVQCN